MKKKLKKICKISLLLATFFLTVAIALSQKNTTYASQLPSGQTDTSNSSNTTRTPGTVDSAADNNNGLSISFQNDSGQVSGTVKIFLVLTNYISHGIP